MSLIDKLWIKFFCDKIGTDQFGNNYYQGRNKNYLGIYKRYVIYQGIEDGSKIPALWHAWLHYSLKEIPEMNLNQLYDWQINHLPNMTGSKFAHEPVKKRKDFMQTYQSWKP